MEKSFSFFCFLNLISNAKEDDNNNAATKPFLLSSGIEEASG